MDYMSAPAPCLRRVIIPGHIVLRPLLGHSIAHGGTAGSQSGWLELALFNKSGLDLRYSVAVRNAAVSTPEGRHIGAERCGQHTQGAPVSLAPSHYCTPPQR